MTGIEKITGRILDDARKYADAAKSDAEKQAGEIIEKARSEAENKASAIIASAGDAAKATVERAHSSSALTRRNILLDAKSRMLDRAFSEAVTSLAGLPDADYIRTMARLLSEAASGFGGKACELFMTSDDAAKRGEAIIRQSGVPGVTLAAGRNTGGGFILRCGDIEVNCSAEVLVGQLRASLEGEVCGILF